MTKARGRRREGRRLGARAPLPTSLLPRRSARRRRSGCQRRPASRGGRGEEGGRARAGGGGCRQTAPPGGAEPSPIRPSRLEPGSASLPIPRSAPAPRSPARRPPPRAHARGRPASLWRWGRAAAQRSFSRQRRPADAQAEPAGCATGAQSAFGDLPERLRGGGGAGRTPRTRPGSLRVRAPRPPPSGLRVPRPPFGSICLTQALYISNSKPLFRLYQNISPQRVIHSPRLIADGFSIKPFPATLHHPPSLNLPP